MDQVTAASDVPVTAAMKRMLPPPAMATAAGSIDTSTIAGAVPCGPPLRPHAAEMAEHSAIHPARPLVRIGRPQMFKLGSGALLDK